MYFISNWNIRILTRFFSHDFQDNVQYWHKPLTYRLECSCTFWTSSLFLRRRNVSYRPGSFLRLERRTPAVVYVPVPLVTFGPICSETRLIEPSHSWTWNQPTCKGFHFGALLYQEHVMNIRVRLQISLTFKLRVSPRGVAGECVLWELSRCKWSSLLILVDLLSDDERNGYNCTSYQVRELVRFRTVPT